MELRLVNPKDLESLEDYAFALLTGIITIQTIETYHHAAVKKGLLKEDQECLANTLVWECKRLQNLYNRQCASVLELLPDDFNVQECIKKIAETQGVKIPKKRTRKNDKTKERI